MTATRRLKLLPRDFYRDERLSDPLRYYFVPLLGSLYRRRVELCLTECRPGRRVLEVGFASGVALPTLAELYREVHGIDLEARASEVAAAFADRGIRAELRNGSVLELPYPEGLFDTVLLISILEHLRPAELERAFAELHRVLAPGGQLVYGVPVERPLMVVAFRCLGHRIREHHFSTHDQVARAAGGRLEEVRTVSLRLPLVGPVYQVGHFRKSGPPR